MWRVLERICLGVNSLIFALHFWGNVYPAMHSCGMSGLCEAKKSVLELGTDCCERNLFHIELLRRIF